MVVEKIYRSETGKVSSVFYGGGMDKVIMERPEKARLNDRKYVIFGWGGDACVAGWMEDKTHGPSSTCCN